jgi:hypothetical protein
MKKWLLGIALALAVTLPFLLKSSPLPINGKEFISSSKSHKPLKTKENIPPTSLNQLAKQKINLNLGEVKDTSSHPCQKIIDPLLDSSFEDLLENSQEFYTNLKEPSGQKTLESSLKNNPQLIDLQKRCLNKISPECESFLLFLKTWAVSLKYPDNIDIADLDETILANKLMFNFSSNPALPVEVLDQNIKILDEMISRNPSLYGAQKAKLIHLFAKEFQYNINVEDEFSSTLDLLNSMKSDRDVDELSLVKNILRKDLDTDKKQEINDNFIQKNPESPKGLYYRASLEWNIFKNPAKTKFWLEKARSVTPNDPQVLHTLEKLNRAKPNQAIFYFSFNFNLQEV